LQSDSLQRPFATSLLAHGVMAGLIVLSGYLHLSDRNWGSEHASSGSVGVNMVSTIPIPRNPGPTNPLANDTKNQTPQEVITEKVKATEKAPEPDAVPLRSLREKPKKVAEKPRPPQNVFKPMAYQPNQIYSKSPQAVSSPMYGMQGTGGIDIGPASVLGNRFGAYVDEMRRQISSHWNRADVRASPTAKCGVSFTIARNGSVSNVQISRASGNYLLDTSAKRAVLDSNPLPSLPPQYSGSEVPVELWFQLKQ
jgi:periplasmic protein TonB